MIKIKIKSSTTLNLMRALTKHQTQTHHRSHNATRYGRHRRALIYKLRYKIRLANLYHICLSTKYVFFSRWKWFIWNWSVWSSSYCLIRCYHTCTYEHYVQCTYICKYVYARDLLWRGKTSKWEHFFVADLFFFSFFYLALHNHNSWIYVVW